MATHSSVLARKILWTEEPGGMQSVGSQSRTPLAQAQQAGAASQEPAVTESLCVHWSHRCELIPVQHDLSTYLCKVLRNNFT